MQYNTPGQIHAMRPRLMIIIDVNLINSKLLSLYLETSSLQ